MNLINTARRAQRFHALHHADRPLVLPNAWDVITARLFEDSGFPAVGTTSFGIARAHGFRDGENAAMDVTLAMVARIAAALDVPLTVDLEAGYADTPEGVAENGRRFIEAGAVGFNLEDGQADGDTPLADPGLQAEKIAALKSAGQSLGVPVFVNARTDVFWLHTASGPAALEAALTRAERYVAAGADGVFLPGLTDREAIAEAAARIGVPLNLLAGPNTPPLEALAKLGVRRLSLGSGPMRATLGLLRRLATELLEQGRYTSLTGALPYDDANRL